MNNYQSQKGALSRRGPHPSPLPEGEGAGRPSWGRLRVASLSRVAGEGLWEGAQPASQALTYRIVPCTLVPIQERRVRHIEHMRDG